MKLLRLQNVDFQYENSVKLFSNFNLELDFGKIYCLIGESGSGKSTLLHLIFGLLDWQKGSIFFEDKNILGPKHQLIPGNDNMKLVSQKSDLMPYAKVSENIGSMFSNINLEKKKLKINELLKLVDLEQFSETLPKYLSGGQLQRVALAKALAKKPKLLLLDEAFSALDDSRKNYVRDELLKYAKINNMSIVVSTHQLQDWLAWTNEIIVMKNGEIISKAEPKFLFQNINDEYTAKLLGEVNVFSEAECEVLKLNTNLVFAYQFEVDDSGFEVEVIESHFSGYFYRNIGKWQEKFLIFYTRIEVSGHLNLRCN